MRLPVMIHPKVPYGEKLVSETNAELRRWHYGEQKAKTVDISFGGVLSDGDFKQLMSLPDDSPWKLVIYPWVPHTKIEGRPSHGQSSYGYDLTLGDEWVEMSKSTWFNQGCPVIRPGQTPERITNRITQPSYILAPQCSVLAVCREQIRIPRHCISTLAAKSTNARVFINLNMTIGEPEWTGRYTLEITNVGEVPVELESGIGIAQLILIACSDPVSICEVSYADRVRPTYQNDQHVQVSKT